MRTHHQVQQRILETAQALFSRFGFKKTTMDDIARAVFRAKSSLYHYFRNKEEIYRAVVEREGRAVKEEIRRAIARADSPVAKLEAYVKTRMLALHRLANFYQAFREEYLESYSFIQKLRQDYDRYEVETVKGILAEGVASGVFSVRDLNLTAVAIITAMKGFEYPWAVATDIAKVEQDIDALMHVLFFGITKR